MTTTHARTIPFAGSGLPSEFEDLLNAVQSLPEAYREALMPAVADAMEQARYRSNALALAAEALAALKLDLQMTQFDLDLTRIEREAARSA